MRKPLLAWQEPWLGIRIDASHGRAGAAAKATNNGAGGQGGHGDLQSSRAFTDHLYGQ
jgi:hypothetical protein